MKEVSAESQAQHGPQNTKFTVQEADEDLKKLAEETELSLNQRSSLSVASKTNASLDLCPGTYRNQFKT